MTALAVLSGCSATAGDSDDVRVTPEETAQTRIFGGAPDSEGHSGVVALRLGDRAPFDICSGALVAPNLVLTARHCVSQMITKKIVCTDQGSSANGAHVGGDRPLQTIQVFAGEQPNFHGRSSASVKAVVHLDGDSLCNGDIALLILDQAPSGAEPMRVRLRGGIKANDRIRAIGYGRSDAEEGIGKRMRRDDIDVLEVGAKLTKSATALGDKEFEVGRSMCQGDSGGPSISEDTSAVVGVVSRGADCNQDFGHVYTQTSGFEALFKVALNGASTSIQDEEGNILTADTISSTSAPSSSTTPSAHGCAINSTQSGSNGAWMGAGLAVALGAVLRRRRSR